jgi:hypothetical protein
MSHAGSSDPSRLIKTNCDDDVKSYNFAISRFKEYLKKRENWFVMINGKNTKTGEKFTFRKNDVHRWKDGYLKKRLARLYKLREWFDLQESHEVMIITLTVPHNENKWGKTVNSGHNHYQAWKNLKQGWARLRQCPVFRNKEFVIIYEPHPGSGYPHIHLMVFGTFTDEETNHLRELWSEMTGAALVGWESCKKRPGEKIWELVYVGAEVRPGIGVKHLISYLVKYMSKTLYHTMSEWTRGEWLFNAIAHEGRHRLFGSSNDLSKIMRLSSDKDDSIETLDVNLCGLKPRDEDDKICSSRMWTNPSFKIDSPIITPISTSERVAAWKLKNNIPESEAENFFKITHEAWLHRGGVDRWRDDKIVGWVLEYKNAVGIA